jgi:4-amino-4-deoxy-L-arabinose transferase-like glycosyltransferase
VPNERTTPLETLAGASPAALAAPRATRLRRFLAERRVLIVLLVLAAVVRLIVLALHAGSPIDMDAAEYVRMGANLGNGTGLVGMRGFPVVELGPLYPLLIAALTWFVRDAHVAALAIVVIAGVAYAGLLSAIARMLYGEPSARVAALIGAVLPILVQLSTETLSEIPYGVALLSGLWALLRYARARRITDAAICAAAFGAAYLTRPEASLLLALGLAIVALASREGARSVRASAAFVAVALVFVVPYAAFTAGVTGHVALESKTTVNFMQAKGMLDGTPYLAVADAVDDAGRPIGPEIAPEYYDPHLRAPHVPLSDRLAMMARAAVRHVHDLGAAFGARECGFGLLIVLSIVGLSHTIWPRTRARDELILFAFVVTLFVALSTVLHYWLRYTVAFVPFAAIWSARGIAELQDWSRRSRIADVGFTFLAMLVTGSLMVDIAEAPAKGIPVEHAAGMWIARHRPHHARVVDVSNRVAFYGGATWAALPYGNEESALHYLTAVAPDYVVLDTGRAGDYPLLARWFAGAPPARCLELMYRIDDGLGRTLRVYRWLSPPPPGGPSLPPPVVRSS